MQPHYKLVHRAEIERELADVCAEYNIAVIPYSPLAGGFLTGKYSPDGQTDSIRAESIKNRYFNQTGWKALDAVRAVAAETDSTPTAVSLAWLLTQPAVTAPIVGANTPDQLAGSLAALELALSKEQVAALDAASAWQ